MSASSFLLKQGSISSALTIIFLILSLLFVKLQINILGIETYGLLVLLLSVFGTINMLNIGIGSAMVEYYTKYGQDKSVFWSLYIASFLVVFGISFIILAISSIFYQSVFNLLGVGTVNLDLFAFIGFSLIGVSRVLGTIVSSYWIAKVDFLILKTFGFLNTYISIGIILLLYGYGNTLNISIFYAGLINIIFIVIVIYKVVFTSVSLKKLKLAFTAKKHFREFIKNGMQFQGLAVINNISNPIINVMISNNLGLEAVSLFDIALKLLRSGRQIIVSITEPFFGKITQLHNQNQKRLIQLLTIKYTKYLMIIAVIYLVTTILFSKYLLIFWVGIEITEKTYAIVNIVALGFAVNIVASIVYNKYLAIKRLRKYILIHQLLLLLFSILPFVLNIKSLEEYALYYSFAFVISSSYLLNIFYKNSRRSE